MSAASDFAGFNTNNYIALQLIGADPVGEQGCPFAFLGPTVVFDEDNGGFDLGSRLASVDGTDAQGLRKAIPVPLAAPGEKDLIGCLRSYEALTTKRVPGRQLSLLEKSQAAAATSPLYEELPFGSEGPFSRREVVSAALAGSGPFETALDVVSAIWKESGCQAERVVLEEEEALLEAGAVTIGGSVVYSSTEPTTGLPLVQSFSTTPGRSVALAVKLGAPIYIPKELFSELACKVIGLGGPEDRASMKISPSQASSWRLPKTPTQFLERAEKAREEEELRQQAQQKPIWQLKASDIRDMSVEQLRYVLQAAAIPSRRSDTKEELVARILPEMDEVERRIVLVEAAVRNEEYTEAAMLQQTQSRRGTLAELIVQAVQEERYYDAAALQEEYEVLTMARADLTQEEGSYDPYLDADDWYIRDLQRIQKKRQQRQQPPP